MRQSNSSHSAQLIFLLPQISNNMDIPTTPVVDACDDVNTCILLVRVGSHMQDHISRKDAYSWMNKVIRKGVNEKGAHWEGDLQKVIPMRQAINGMEYKVQFEDVPEQLIQDVILPVLQKADCQVKRLSKDAERTFRVAKTQSLIQQLIALRGNGGSDAKRRRFSEDLTGVYNRSSRVGSAKLQELKEEKEEKEED